jgi:signal transduction histidine kinase
LQRCWTKGEPWEDTFRLKGKDGTYRWFLSRALPIRDAAGSVASWFGTNTDITDRKQAEEALVKSERLAAMGRLAGIIAHEINNPLEAISNAFYLLHDHPSLDEEARYYSRLAEEELARITHITKQTLSFYRESQQPMAVSLSEILDNVVELQSRKLQLNRIILKKNFRTTGTIHGFSVELKQVFLNIITNAAQAMPEGGELRVDLIDSRDWKTGQVGLRVNICDTGVGIDSQNSKKIFEPFFSTKEAKGTGLGLWISKGIIQKYGGSIRFRTMRFKTGNVTCFSVFMPGNAAAESADLASALSAS